MPQSGTSIIEWIVLGEMGRITLLVVVERLKISV